MIYYHYHITIVFEQKENLSAEEYQAKRSHLLNKHQLEQTQLEQQLADELRNIEQEALLDWQLRLAHDKLSLKQKHYKVRHHEWEQTGHVEMNVDADVDAVTIVITIRQCYYFIMICDIFQWTYI